MMKMLWAWLACLILLPFMLVGYAVGVLVDAVVGSYQKAQMDNVIESITRHLR